MRARHAKADSHEDEIASRASVVSIMLCCLGGQSDSTLLQLRRYYISPSQLCEYIPAVLVLLLNQRMDLCAIPTSPPAVEIVKGLIEEPGTFQMEKGYILIMGVHYIYTEMK